jgi:hypothetical protein
MQDDCYPIADDGWKAETTRILVSDTTFTARPGWPQ